MFLGGLDGPGAGSICSTQLGPPSIRITIPTTGLRTRLPLEKRWIAELNSVQARMSFTTTAFFSVPVSF
jgi:hypothetical protein